MELFSSLGGATYLKRSKKMIRLILKGCTNRPFFHISVQEATKEPEEPVIEQIGNYDPMPNKYNEKLVAFNFQRLEYWLRKGAEPTPSVKKLLGLCGYFPVHPESFQEAYLKRKRIIEELEKLKVAAAKLSSVDNVRTNKSVEEPFINSSKSTLEEESNNVVTEESQSVNGPDNGASKN